MHGGPVDSSWRDVDLSRLAGIERAMVAQQLQKMQTGAVKNMQEWCSRPEVLASKLSWELPSRTLAFTPSFTRRPSRFHST